MGLFLEFPEGLAPLGACRALSLCAMAPALSGLLTWKQSLLPSPPHTLESKLFKILQPPTAMTLTQRFSTCGLRPLWGSNNPFTGTY